MPWKPFFRLVLTKVYLFFSILLNLACKCWYYSFGGGNFHNSQKCLKKTELWTNSALEVYRPDAISRAFWNSYSWKNPSLGRSYCIGVQPKCFAFLSILFFLSISAMFAKGCCHSHAFRQFIKLKRYSLAKDLASWLS